MAGESRPQLVGDHSVHTENNGNDFVGVHFLYTLLGILFNQQLVGGEKKNRLLFGVMFFFFFSRLRRISFTYMLTI